MPVSELLNPDAHAPLSAAAAKRLRGNLAEVRGRMAMAADRAGRGTGAVRLIAVTKTVTAPVIAELHRAGQVDFGESRAQAARDKIAMLAANLPEPALASLQWHGIGHLQSNKVNLALKLFNVIHAVDSFALADAIGRRMSAAPAGEVRARAGEGGVPAERMARVPVYLEVNVSGEASKHGVAPAAVIDLARQVVTRPGIQLRGLMTMAPFEASETVLRTVFSRLRRLRDELAAEVAPECRDLSMGMSGDFEVAIEEGATHVRVGSALFA